MVRLIDSLLHLVLVLHLAAIALASRPDQPQHFHFSRHGVQKRLRRSLLLVELSSSACESGSRLVLQRVVVGLGDVARLQLDIELFELLGVLCLGLGQGTLQGAGRERGLLVITQQCVALALRVTFFGRPLTIRLADVAGR